MAKSTFGERLRREREMRGVALDEIAAATRISTRFLEALENEQWDRLPGGVFNRGFIRAVAHYLGLNEESLMAEYSAATNDHPQVATWATPPPRSTAARSGPRRWLVTALLLTLGAGGWFAWQEVSPLVAAWRGTQRSAQPPTAPAKAPAVAALDAPEPTAAAAGESAPSAAEMVTLELKVDVGKTTRLTVSADGQIRFQGRVLPGQQHRFEAQREFEISAADSSALLFELNGQTMPPLAPPGEPGRIRLTRDDLGRAQQTPPASSRP